MAELSVKCLYVYGDSALVINQLNKDWDTTSKKMDAYCKAIRKLEGKFYGIEYTHVVRDKNQAADALSKLGSSQAKVPTWRICSRLARAFHRRGRSHSRQASRPTFGGYGFDVKHHRTTSDH